MSPGALSVAYKAPATVARMLRSNARYRAIVGPVGSGKSSGCCIEIPRRAFEQRPGPDGIRRTRFAIIRNSYRELKDTTHKTFHTWVPEALGKSNKTEFTWTMEAGDVHCEVLFRALDSPDDVRKLLSLELTGAYVNEGREMAKEIWDGLGGRVGRYPSIVQGGPTWHGVWMDTNPWSTSHWGYQLFSLEKPPKHELYEQPSGLSPYAENVENLPADYYPDLCHGKSSDWVDEYVRSKYPNADKGSIYGEWMAKLRARGQIHEFDYPRDGIYASFDLGVSDSTAIWFWRFNNARAVDVVDYHEAHGEGASHYFEVLKAKGYKYEKIFLPHDARQREFSTGGSTLDRFLEAFPGKVAITPELSVAQGIDAARFLLEQPVRFHLQNTAEGVKRLKGYRFEFDAKHKVYRKTPLHDFNSHGADAWRYVACAVKSAEIYSRPEPKESKPKPRVGYVQVDDEWLDEAPSR